MKKIVALILAALMLLSLAACGGSAEETTAASKETAEEKTEKEEKTTEAQKDNGASDEEEASDEQLSLYDQAIEERRAEYEETGVYEKIAFTWYVWSPQSGEDRIEEALNEIFREELCLEIDLNLMAASDFRQNVPLMLSAGEQVDWFASNGIGYTASVNNDYCVDLEEDDLIYNYGEDILEYFLPEYIEASRIGGVLYCIPPVKDIAITYGAFMISKEALDLIGYEYVEDPDLQEVVGLTYDDITDILTQITATGKYDHVYQAMSNWFTQGSKIDPIGGDSFGVLEDPCNSLEVTNLFGCDEWNETTAMLRKWNELGFFSADAITNGTGGEVKSGAACAYNSQGKPGYKSQVAGECAREMIVFRMGDDIIKASGVTNVCMSLAYNCEDTVAAMQAMNLFNGNAEAMQLLCWGQEGIDYQYTDDGHVTYAEGVDGSNCTYHHTCNWEMPNQYLSTPWEGDPLDLGQKTIEFNANANQSLAMGFTFDNTEYSAEYTALTNKYNELYKQIMFGFAEDPVAYTEEMNEQLNANGLQEYIQAKADALAEWAAAKGK